MTYILRLTDPADVALWSSFRHQAHADGWGLRALLLELVRQYVTGEITVEPLPKPPA